MQFTNLFVDSGATGEYPSNGLIRVNARLPSGSTGISAVSRPETPESDNTPSNPPETLILPSQAKCFNGKMLLRTALIYIP